MDRVAVLVLEHEGAFATGSRIEFHPVREPLDDLVGLGDGPPHDLDRRLYHHFALDLEVSHGRHPQLLTDISFGHGVALPSSNPALRPSRK